MALQLKIIDSVEKLDYRVTVGDVASYSGISPSVVQKELLSLASDTFGNLQVTESGTIIYIFSKNLRTIFFKKNLISRLNVIWTKVWAVLFYLIRISFGVILISSILVVLAAIVIIITSLQSDREENNRYSNQSRGISFFFLPNFGDLFWIFYPTRSYNSFSSSKYKEDTASEKITFLEAVFSFLFGDGNPNLNLEEIRWEIISRVIYNNKGVVIAEQLAPYLDGINKYNEDNEDYVLPVLKRFAGIPNVTSKGELIYSFPELQTFTESLPEKHVNTNFEEKLYNFTRISSSQKVSVVSLGVINFILVLVLGSLLKDQNIILELDGFIGFINSFYWFLFSYASLFLGLPLIRYFVIQSRNTKINIRNSKRKERSSVFNRENEVIKHKLRYVAQFLNQGKHEVSDSKLVYTTEKGVIEQSDNIDL